MARELWTATLLISGCAGSAAPHAPPPSRVAEPPQPIATAKPALPPLFQVGVVPRPEAPDIEVVAPAPGVSLAVNDARATTITLGGAVQEAPFVELSLDGARARPLATLPTPPRLADLEGPGTALGVGEHYLVVSARSEADAPARHKLTRFFVGEPAPKTAGPLVYCSRPEGTYYAGTANLLLDFVTDGLSLGKDAALRVRAFDPHGNGRAQREGLLESSEPVRLVPLDERELTFELTLVDRAGRPYAGRFTQDRCSVTQNEAKP